jgi:hypothetical protein
MDHNFLNFQSIIGENFLEFIIRFFFNFIIIYAIAKGIYYRVRKRSNILFALFMLNILVFFVCYLLQSVQLSIGFAFGIFAIFSILRYRTTTVPIKEMTYIFISISIAIFNALTNINTGYGIMIFTNITIVVFTFAFERIFIKNESVKTITYDNIDLIKPEKYNELLEDLKQRTGLNVHRCEIGRLNFIRDTARLRIYYYDKTVTDDEETAGDNDD